MGTMLGGGQEGRSLSEGMGPGPRMGPTWTAGERLGSKTPPPPPQTAAQTISCACKGTFPFSSLRHVHVDNFGGAVSTFTRRLHFMEAVYTPFPPLPLKPPPQKIQEAVRSPRRFPSIHSPYSNSSGALGTPGGTIHRAGFDSMPIK